MEEAVFVFLYQQSYWAKWDHNELQLVELPEYRLNAMCGAHKDVGHLGLKWILDILHD